MEKVKSDNFSTDDHWILVTEDMVYISKQRDGFPCEAAIQIPKDDFEKIVKWYIKNNPIK